MTNNLVIILTIGGFILILLFVFRLLRIRKLHQKEALLEKQLRTKLAQLLKGKELKQLSFKHEIDERFAGRILTTTELNNYIQTYAPLYFEIERLLYQFRSMKTKPNEYVLHFTESFCQITSLAKKHNEKLKQQLLQQHSDFFEHCLTYPLDNQQRKAIISEEENTLVISSAGSGKTSSIVGKVKYLTQVKGIKPHRILLISYTNKAATELTERIQIPGLYGQTFHKLALNIIARHTGTKPVICENTDRLFVRIFRQLSKESKTFKQAILSYFIDFPNDEETWLQLKQERQAHLSEKKHRQQKALFPDMDGNPIQVKSKQEKKLCFILHALGVNFRYEEPYEHRVEDENHSQYHPDFSIYFTQGGEQRRIYLEHYAVDEHGCVPLWFAQDKNLTYEEANQKYNDGITWKKELHHKMGTTLITTSSADFKYLDVQKELKNKLMQAGVPIHEKTSAELYETILPQQSREEKSFIRFVVTFITLLKSSCLPLREVIGRIKQTGDERAEFIVTQIFKPIYKEYQQTLENLQQIDFTDAIIQATDICSKQPNGAYDYIIVDEFQDISVDRYHFLQALRKGNTPAKLFCVGDDWQSIYRFSGSDMTLFSQFKKYFGPTEIDKIETTYRFGQPLVHYSSTFIQRNPQQFQKQIRPFNAQAQTQLLFQAYQRASYCLTIEALIERIPADKSIFLLGRYSFDDYYLSFKYKSHREGDRIYYVIQGRKLEFLTVHKSKGLEADYVILLQCNKDTLGFPSLIHDDPVLNYVLSENDSFPFSEERRLFYVAITRAKICTYVCYDERFPSVFVDEFLRPDKLTTQSDDRHRNANKRWTQKADNFLLQLHQEGRPVAYISRTMGRSQTAIVMRLKKLLAS